MSPRSAFAVAMLVLAASPALAAAGGDGHADPWASVIWPWVNFLTLVAVLVYVGRKPVRDFFSQRREAISGEIDAAGELLQRAEARHDEWQRKMIELDGELEEIRATARQRASDERDRILVEARDAAERIRNDASAAAEQELLRAREELREEAATIAIELAAQLLADGVNEGDRDRLLDEFISHVENGAGR